MWDNQHYKGEQKDVVQRLPPILRLGFLVGNVMKYNTRSGQKETEPWSKDFKKGRHYSIMLEELLEQTPLLKALLENPDQWLNEATETPKLPQAEEKVYESRLQVQYTHPDVVRLDTSDAARIVDALNRVDLSSEAAERSLLATKAWDKEDEAPEPTEKVQKADESDEEADFETYVPSPIPSPYHYILPKGVVTKDGDESWVIDEWLTSVPGIKADGLNYRRKLPMDTKISPGNPLMHVVLPEECKIGNSHFQLPVGEPIRAGDEVWELHVHAPTVPYWRWGKVAENIKETDGRIFRRKLPH